MRRNLQLVLKISFIVLFLFSGLLIHSQTKTVIDPFTIPSARFSALGGNHAAMGDTFHAIFTNPASFVDIKGEFSAAEISISTYGPIFELTDVLISNLHSSGDLDLSGGKFSSTGFDMAGPISLGWVGKGLGLGLFNRLKIDAEINSTNIMPGISGEILLVAGYSFRVINHKSHWLDLGFLGKGFFRGVVGFNTYMLNISDLLEDPLEHPFSTYLGMGIDLGIRYTFRENLAFSVVCFDVFSPVLETPYKTIQDFTDFSGKSLDSSYASVKRRLDFGIKWTIRNRFLNRNITRLTLMADYHDLLDLFTNKLIPRNPVLNAGIGLEMLVLDALSFRFGITDALPSFGIGLSLKFMTLDFAIFGRELGKDPGKYPTYGLALGILFRY